MKKSKKQKRRVYGYALFINRSGEKNGWTREGFLFGFSLEADRYRESHFPTIKKWSIQAVRLNCEPVGRGKNDPL